MTFWESVTGKIARFRSSRADADKTFFLCLRDHINRLSHDYSKIPGLGIQLRDLIASVYAGVDSCTNEKSLDRLGSYRDQFLNMNSRDFLRFSAAFNAEISSCAGLSPHALNLFLDAVQQSHNLDATFAISWGQLPAAAHAAGVDAAVAIQRFRNDQIRPIVGISDWGISERAYWDEFARDVSVASTSYRVWSGFSAHVESMIDLYSRAGR
jgi:hypothetical protein